MIDWKPIAELPPTKPGDPAKAYLLLAPANADCVHVRLGSIDTDGHTYVKCHGGQMEIEDLPWEYFAELRPLPVTTGRVPA